MSKFHCTDESCCYNPVSRNGDRCERHGGPPRLKYAAEALSAFTGITQRQAMDNIGKALREFSKKMPTNVTDKSDEQVNHPNHYAGTHGIECMEAIENALTPEEFRGFCKGNAIKYVWRAGKKNADKFHEDMAKAGVYVAKIDNPGA